MHEPDMAEREEREESCTALRSVSLAALSFASSSRRATHSQWSRTQRSDRVCTAAGRVAQHCAAAPSRSSERFGCARELDHSHAIQRLHTQFCDSSPVFS